MTQQEERKAFRTLKGFLDGEEPDEENYFHYCATLRIHGNDIPFDEISLRLGVEPTYIHRKGEKRRPSSRGYPDDAWHFCPAIAETEPLERHIDALWQTVKPHVDYLKILKHQFQIDVFCGYRSNCDHAGLQVSHKCLELFMALEVPFGISIIVI
ncbi:MAG: DUF4279 domain-containing protein [Caldilineaceae bacterium]